MALKMMTRTHIKNTEREELLLWQRKLRSLWIHGTGQVGSCSELRDAKRIADEIEERLNPKPLPDLAAQAAAVIDRFGYSPWVLSAIEEAEEQ